MSPTEIVEQLAAELAELSPARVVSRAMETFGEDIAVSFSGAEDVLLIEYAHQHVQRAGGHVRVFSLDTGRLHPETYRFFQAVEQHYQLHIEYVFPQAAAVEALVRKKGMFSFLQDGHKECCGIRKVTPLRRQLSGLRAWITGQRRDQSPGTRADVPLLQVDPAFSNADGTPLVKFNPLAAMTSAEVWAAIGAFEVPFNELHRRGYVSIGCEPCTRAVLPGQHEREGRWWWELAGDKECGLHVAKSD